MFIKKIDYLTCTFIVTLIVWIFLLFSQLFQLVTPDKISSLAGQVEFIVHFFSLIALYPLYDKMNLEDRNILKWFVIANVCLFFNDLFFYISVYFTNEPILSSSFFTFILGYIPYLIWILSIMIFLSKILVRNIINVFDFFKALPFFILINLLITFLFFSSIDYAFNYLSWKNISHIISFMSEFIIFDLAILSFIYSESFEFSLCLSGFITLISGDFFVNYTFLSQTNSLLHYGELLWFLGLLLILFSIFFVLKNKSYEMEKWFSQTNNIKNKMAFWSFGTSILSFLLFFITAYIFSAIDTHFFLGLPIFVMMYSVIVVISSIHMGKHFEAPFKKLTANVEALMLKNDRCSIDDNFSTQEFIFLQRFIVKAFEIKEQKEQTQKNLFNLATQVAHDIRSPLAAINTALSHVISIPEQKRIIIRNAANRINDIANHILIKSKNNFSDSSNNKSGASDSPELIFAILDNIVAEKNYEYDKTNVSIQLKYSECSLNCFSTVNIASLKRVLSNLINNSIEAISSGGNIVISLTCNTDYVIIILEDNGCGIPSHVLPTIAEQGFSFNKKNGAGIGLTYAKQYLNQISGTLHIESKEKIGTKITICLSRSTYPLWFCNSIKVKSGSSIIILDDDPTIHDAWNERFAEISNIELKHLYNVAELQYSNVDPIKPILYLIDYEFLGESQNGLDLIEHLKLQDRSILVTSSFENHSIRLRCKNIGIKIIPKPYVPFIEIVLIPKDTKRNLIVLIDNDEMMRTTWAFAASDANLHIALYPSIDEFMNVVSNYSSDTIIYIDSDLGNNIKGEIEAKKLFDLGFTEIHLATGHSPKRFENMPWLKSIIGKLPPF